MKAPIAAPLIAMQVKSAGPILAISGLARSW